MEGPWVQMLKTQVCCQSTGSVTSGTAKHFHEAGVQVETGLSADVYLTVCLLGELY